MNRNDLFIVNYFNYLNAINVDNRINFIITLRRMAAREQKSGKSLFR